MDFRLAACILALAGNLLGGPSAAGEQNLVLRVTEADCANIIKHIAHPDVTYRPGVDVRGNAVKPADVNGGNDLGLSGDYRVTIEVDTADRLGIPADPDRYDADVQVGDVVVDQAGNVYFNGKPLGDRYQQDIARHCREMLR